MTWRPRTLRGQLPGCSIISNLFTYGTLMSVEIMLEVSAHRSFGIPATLADFQRLAVRGEDYPGIIRQKGDKVSGVLYCGLTKQALALLDHFEGEMYQRIVVEVKRDDSPDPVQAFTYLVKPDCRDQLADTPWDFETFLKVAKTRFQREYRGYRSLPEE